MDYLVTVSAESLAFSCLLPLKEKGKVGIGPLFQQGQGLHWTAVFLFDES